MKMTEAQRIAFEEVKRRQNAERAARFRQKHRDTPIATVVDRVVLEAYVLALGDPGIVDKETASRIGREASRLAEMGLHRLGYDAAPARKALSRRMREHAADSRGSAVKGALRDLEQHGRVRRVRHRDDVTH